MKLYILIRSEMQMKATTMSTSSADETLTRLVKDPQVLGCMILLRAKGNILKQAGPLFDLPASSTTTTGNTSADTSTSHQRSSTSHSLDSSSSSSSSVHGNKAMADEYALRAWNMVKALSSETLQLSRLHVDPQVEPDESHLDDFRLARIRTRKHELIIAPGEFCLVVLRACLSRADGP